MSKCTKFPCPPPIIIKGTLYHPDQVVEILQLEQARIAELEAELKRLRWGIDDLKVRSYELGQRELHDAALALLEKGE